MLTTICFKLMQYFEISLKKKYLKKNKKRISYNIAAIGCHYRSLQVPKTKISQSV